MNEVSQYHSFDGGIYLGRHPSAKVTTSCTEHGAKMYELYDETRDYLATVPDKNAQYQQSIAWAKEIIGPEVEGVPVKILNPQEYLAAAQALNKPDMIKTGGALIGGHVVVRDYEGPKVRELFGNDFQVKRTLSHELAHAAATKGTPLMYTEGGTELDGTVTITAMHYLPPSQGFNKHRKTPDGSQQVGSFFEEGHVELTAMQAMGITQEVEEWFDDFAVVQGDVYYYGQDMPPRPRAGDALPVPVRYAQRKLVEHQGRTGAVVLPANTTSLAAYGIDLLDELSPGLYDDMKAARKDPGQFSKVVARIEGVQPGLYRHLRELQYDRISFKIGVHAIRAAADL